jgi:hypothetical protein
MRNGVSTVDSNGWASSEGSGVILKNTLSWFADEEKTIITLLQGFAVNRTIVGSLFEYFDNGNLFS